MNKRLRNKLQLNRETLRRTAGGGFFVDTMRCPRTLDTCFCTGACGTFGCPTTGCPSFATCPTFETCRPGGC